MNQANQKGGWKEILRVNFILNNFEWLWMSLTDFLVSRFRGHSDSQGSRTLELRIS